MRYLCLSAALMLVLSALIAPAQDKPAGRMSKQAEQVVALDREWANAVASGDVKKLDQLFSDDLIVTSSNGTLRNKAAEIDDVRPSPDIKTYFFNTDEIRVRVYKDAAVLTGRARWRINIKGRGDIDHERRYTSVYAKERGRWRMVALQLTRTPQPQPQPSPSK